MVALAEQPNTMYPKQLHSVNEHHLDIFGMYFDKDSTHDNSNSKFIISKLKFVNNRNI